MVASVSDASLEIAPPGPFSRARPPLWLLLTQLGALSFHLPILFTTNNWRANSSLVVATAVALAVLVVSLLLHFGLGRLLKSHWKALEATSVALIAFWHWRAFESDTLTPGTPILGMAIGVLLLVFASRFADHRYMRVGAYAVSVTLLVAGCVVLASLAIQSPVTSIEKAPSISLDSTSPKPDIYLFFVDGYGRADVLAEDYGFDNSTFVDSLREQGFFVADDSTANYSGTHFSMASILSMDYIAEEGPDITVADLRELGLIIGGDNPTVAALKEAGYTYVHGSSDWWGNDCGRQADFCMATPLIDITSYDLLNQTPIRYLLYRETGDPGTKIALTRLQEFRDRDSWARSWGDDPLFVFMHVLIPHPPLFLDVNCEPRTGDLYAQRRLNSYPPLPPTVVEVRKTAYVDQVVCTNTMIQALVDAVPQDAVMLIMSDHGPDSRSQIALPAETWNAAARTERFGNLVALRTPCNDQADSDIDAVNVLRFSLRCVFDADLPDLDGRYFVVPSARYTGPLREVDAPTKDFS